jgi:hypothetical protein
MTEHPDHEHPVTVEIIAPREPDDARPFTFPDTLEVGAAAREAADAYGYKGGNPSLRTEDKRVLDRHVTLTAAGVHDHELLELVDAGGGVAAFDLAR